MSEPAEIANAPIPSGEIREGMRKRKKSSEVWEHFNEVQVKGKNKEMEKKLECKYCRSKYKNGKSGTTSQLKRHLKACPYFKREQGKSKGLIQIGNDDQMLPLGLNEGYDQLKCREIIAKMIMVHELAFLLVEYEWFNILMKFNNPLYQKVSRTTIKKDCLKVYECEKEKIKTVFQQTDKISLTCDCWTSNQTIGYMCVTAHYIDDDWKLQKRIISFNELSPPHSGEVISDSILDALMNWGIQNKIGTITIDNASNNDRAANILKFNFSGRGKLHFQGFFFHVQCCAHILNLVVQDGLNKIEDCVFKLREGVKYLKKTPGRILKFGEISTQLGISTRLSLCLDVKTRWNSTHRMINSALHYRTVFPGYALRDPNFEWCPNVVEWENPEKAIFDAYVSEDGFMREMGKAMYEKFGKYWGEISVLMAVAAILDPRLKLKYVRFCFSKLYPSPEVDECVEDVTRKLHTLYELYEKEYHVGNVGPNSLNSVFAEQTNSNKATTKPLDDEYLEFLRTTENGSTHKSDLETYLEERAFAEGKSDYNVLDWWKGDCVKYPILSKLARDILCIPISTVASESAFSAGGRVLDDYRSSLSKNMVEALVCGGD